MGRWDNGPNTLHEVTAVLDRNLTSFLKHSIRVSFFQGTKSTLARTPFFRPSHDHPGLWRAHGPSRRVFERRRSILLHQKEQALRDQEVERRRPLGLGYFFPNPNPSFFLINISFFLRVWIHVCVDIWALELCGIWWFNSCWFMQILWLITVPFAETISWISVSFFPNVQQTIRTFFIVLF